MRKALRFILPALVLPAFTLAGGQETISQTNVEDALAVENVEVMLDSSGAPTLIEFDLINRSERGIIAVVSAFHATPVGSASQHCRPEQSGMMLLRGVALGSPLRSIAPQEVIHLQEEASNHFQCDLPGVEIDVSVDLVLFEDFSYASRLEKEELQATLEYLRGLRSGSRSERYFLKRLLDERGPEALVEEINSERTHR